MVKSAVCTLFEGHYHYGVAALTNSLFKAGFRGLLFIGYRGALPFWASEAKENTTWNWDGVSSLDVEEGLELHFVPLSTNYHLTNFKPDFMLQIFNALSPQIDSLFYFDPDIVVSAPWSFFEEWVNCGVALCEDVNSPIPEFHPRRVAWREYFSKDGFNLIFKNPVYVNGGFVGLRVKDLQFLSVWKNLQESMSPAIGGLNKSSLAGEPLPKTASGPFAPFGKTDQDALNAAVEAYRGESSIIGKEAMGFITGEPLMPHALGSPKPWKDNYLEAFIKGKTPSVSNKAYWENANGAILSYSRAFIKRKIFFQRLASFLGRFYSK